MLKLLFLTNNLCGGGAEKVLVNLVNELATRGYDVTVCSLVDSGVNKEFLSRDVKYKFVFKKYFRGMNYLHLLPHKFIYNVICNGEYDIVVPYLQGVLTKICSYAPVNQKRIAWFHAEAKASSTLFKIRNKKNELNQYFSGYNKVICVSKGSKESFCALSGLHENVDVLFNTYSLSDIIEKSKEHLDIDKRCPILCYTGHFDGLCRIKYLINISHRLNEEGYKNSLIILGNGPEYEEDVEYAKALDVNLIAPGFVVNPYMYMKNADIYIDASSTAGLSTALIEALTLGLACVSTDIPGARDVLGDNNEYGIVVESSEDALYSAVKELLSDRDLLEMYKAKAVASADRFSVDVTVGAVEKMLEEVLCQN